MINVTKTFLPPYDEYGDILKRAWDNHWLTNRGQLVLELEEKLKRFLQVENIILTNNGTIPIQIALKLLGRSGEVITTPFSYVATTASIVWEHCVPVFVDIDEDYLTIDERKIENAITGKTTAILATHVFGNPCNVDKIEQIANRHGLKVIYDGAHGFGVKYKGRSIFDYGDVSTCSFHATKLFHTAEGGAIFCKNPDLHDQLFYSHNFGHNGPLAFFGLGINAKISELQAAMGLSIFPYLEFIIAERAKVVGYYHRFLESVRLRKMRLRSETEWNNSYFPVIFHSVESMLDVQAALNRKNIFPRRYFYPSLNTIEYTRGESMPVSEAVADRILCLPLYVGLLESEVQLICEIVNEHVK